MTERVAAPRPAQICRGLLGALDASEGRRKRRKRDTKPDAIGLAIKRTLLEEAVRDDPAPEEFEGWLLDRCTRVARRRGSSPDESSGSLQAMARMILEEWRLAVVSSEFHAWLATGAPSDDAERAARRTPHPERGDART